MSRGAPAGIVPAVLISILMLVASLIVAGAMAATLMWFFRRLRAVERAYGSEAP